LLKVASKALKLPSGIICNMLQKVSLLKRKYSRFEHNTHQTHGVKNLRYY